MDDVLSTIIKMETKQNDFYSKLKKKLIRYENENQKLKEELKSIKLQYLVETEIIVKLDQKIYDLKNENEKLKGQINIKN